MTSTTNEEVPVREEDAPVRLETFTLDQFGRYELVDCDLFELVAGGSNWQCGSGGGGNTGCNIACQA